MNAFYGCTRLANIKFNGTTTQWSSISKGTDWKYNVPAKVVQKWLGHSTLEMTLNVYTHVNRDFESEMSQKIDTYFDT